MAIAPALSTLFFPAVEIERVAAYPNHPVDRGRTTQHLAARRGEPSSGQMRLRLGGKTPIVSRHVHRDRQRGRHLKQHRAIRAAELQQQHTRDVPSSVSRLANTHPAEPASTTM